MMSNKKSLSLTGYYHTTIENETAGIILRMEKFSINFRVLLPATTLFSSLLHVEFHCS